MLSEYIQSAMRKAKYKILEDGSYHGEITGFQGIWANEKNLEQCRQTLQEVLEEWILLKVRDRDELPLVNGKRLKLPALTHA